MSTTAPIVPALNSDVLSSLNLPPLDLSKLPPLDPNLLKTTQAGNETYNPLQDNRNAVCEYVVFDIYIAVNIDIVLCNWTIVYYRNYGS